MPLPSYRDYQIKIDLDKEQHLEIVGFHVEKYQKCFESNPLPIYTYWLKIALISDSRNMLHSELFVQQIGQDVLTVWNLYLCVLDKLSILPCFAAMQAERDVIIAFVCKQRHLQAHLRYW